MDSNEYLVEMLMRDRMRRAEAAARVLDLLAAAPRRAPVPWRVWLGRVLIRLGRALAQPAPRARHA